VNRSSGQIDVGDDEDVNGAPATSRHHNAFSCASLTLFHRCTRIAPLSPRDGACADGGRQRRPSQLISAAQDARRGVFLVGGLGAGWHRVRVRLPPRAGLWFCNIKLLFAVAAYRRVWMDETIYFRISPARIAPSRFSAIRNRTANIIMRRRDGLPRSAAAHRHSASRRARGAVRTRRYSHRACAARLQVYRPLLPARLWCW